jgi:hypothetical protein
MEVHHHSHPNTSSGHRKKWSNYFWEFMMLFLAVFCGFMAENIREHKIEHKRAKQFALSLLSDIKEDTVALHTAINYGDRKVRNIDSLVLQIEKPREQWNDSMIYVYEGIAGRIRPFVHNSGTYDQMKASGSLRYFSHELSDLLNQYSVQATKTKVRDDIHLNYASNLLNPFIMTIVDTRGLIHLQNNHLPTRPLVLRKTDKETVSLWINYATVVQSTQERSVVEYRAMLAKAEQVIETLKKEYRLD